MQPDTAVQRRRGTGAATPQGNLADWNPLHHAAVGDVDDRNVVGGPIGGVRLGPVGAESDAPGPCPDGDGRHDRVALDIDEGKQPAAAGRNEELLAVMSDRHAHRLRADTGDRVGVDDFVAAHVDYADRPADFLAHVRLATVRRERHRSRSFPGRHPFDDLSRARINDGDIVGRLASHVHVSPSRGTGTSSAKLICTVSAAM